MPVFIIKPDRDRDEYVTWSTVVDAPCQAGTRAEIEAMLGEDAEPARFERADQNGTSYIGGDWYGYETDRFLYQAWGIGFYWLPRHQLAAACRIQNDRGDRAVIDELGLAPAPPDDEDD